MRRTIIWSIEYSVTGGRTRRVYLDVSIMVGSVLDKAESRQEIGMMFNLLQSSSYRIVVPHLVMGETVTLLAKKGRSPHTNAVLLCIN